MANDIASHSEVVFVAFEKAERTSVNNDLTISASSGILASNAEGFSKTEERAAFNGRTAAVGVVACDDESAFATLDEGAVIFAVDEFVTNGLSAFCIPTLSRLFLGKLFKNPCCQAEWNKNVLFGFS